MRFFQDYLYLVHDKGIIEVYEYTLANTQLKYKIPVSGNILQIEVF